MALIYALIAAAAVFLPALLAALVQAARIIV
jgi:hypothetical protein